MATVVTLTTVAAGCNSDDAADAATTTPPPTTMRPGTTQAPTSTRAAPGTTTSAPTTAATTTTPPTTEAESTTLTGEQICERLTLASVSADLGQKVTAAVPDDTVTPQCTYEYTNDDDVRTTLTVAAMRPIDVEGATGADAFEYTVSANRSIAGEDAEEQEIDAGDEAVRLTGPLLHLGIVRIGDHVYTVIVPVDDAGIDAIDQLIGTMATTLS